MMETSLHNFAVRIESVLRIILNSEKNGVDGLVNADIIESNWNLPIGFILGYLYLSKKTEVDSFYKDNGYYLDIGLNKLLKIINDAKSIDKSEYDIEQFENGEAVIEKIITDLEQFIK